MKVLFVVTAFPRYPGDVITPWLLEEIRGLKKYGVEVDVFTSSYKGLKSGLFEDIMVYRFRYCFKRYENLTHEEMAADRYGRGLRYKFIALCYLLFGIKAIYQHCRRNRYDVVHIHWPFPHIIFGFFARKARPTKLVVTFYGAEVRWLRKKFAWLSNIMRYLLRSADAFIAISTHIAAEINSLVEQKVSIIPFGAACEAGDDVRTSDDKFILFVGRLVERKGVKILIEAFSRIHNLIPHRLVIVGDGPEKNDLMIQATQLKLDQRVEFAGWVPSFALKEYFRKCTVFVNPSIVDRRGDTESLGVVQLEAMTFAKPVIASRVGGIVDTIEDGKSGILVPPGDPERLAQALLDLTRNQQRARRLGNYGKKLVRTRFNWDRIIKKVIDLYEECN